jgi:phosphatidylinositol alpha-1,6-mannosyltransferase
VGGIESFVLAMAQRLDPASVVVHTARQAGDAEFDAGLPFPVVRDPSRIMLPTPAITRRVAATSRRYGCDSVWFGAAAPLGLMASALRSHAGVRRTVATTHGHEVWWARTPGFRQLLRRIGDANDVVTYVAEFTRTAIAKALSPAAAHRMVRLTPGVDTERFHPDVEGTPVRARYGLVGRRVVVCVSRFVERKGQDVLVEAWPAVRREVPGAALLLVGDGPIGDKLRRRVGELAIGDDVVFAGSKPWSELPPFFAAGDVFCMPTRTRKRGLEVEALGIVYLEAAACALPVVVGDSGGAPETVDPGRTGLVVDGRSPADVSQALVTLLRDPARAGAMGRAGRERVLSGWTWAQAEETLRSHLQAG